MGGLKRSALCFSTYSLVLTVYRRRVRNIDNSIDNRSAGSKTQFMGSKVSSSGGQVQDPRPHHYNDKQRPSQGNDRPRRTDDNRPSRSTQGSFRPFNKFFKANPTGFGRVNTPKNPATNLPRNQGQSSPPSRGTVPSRARTGRMPRDRFQRVGKTAGRSESTSRTTGLERVLEHITQPVGMKYRRKPRLHKGKMSLCPCCNPGGYLKERRLESRRRD